MRIAAFFLLFLGLFSCGGPANRPVDVFIWDQLRADEDPERVEPAGTCGADEFLAEMERFPWHEQAREALKFRKNSPTLSVTDLKTDRSLFISSAVDNKEHQRLILMKFFQSCDIAGEKQTISNNADLSMKKS